MCALRPETASALVGLDLLHSIYSLIELLVFQTWYGDSYLNANPFLPPFSFTFVAISAALVGWIVDLASGGWELTNMYTRHPGQSSTRDHTQFGTDSRVRRQEDKLV